MPLQTTEPTLFANTLAERFAAFDAAHPEVYELFRQYVFQVRYAGRKRFGARAIIERIRWDHAVNPNSDGGFKINNDFCSRYARKLIAQFPELDGFLEFRTLKAA